jgi:hypothetical protein
MISLSELFDIARSSLGADVTKRLEDFAYVVLLVDGRSIVSVSEPKLGIELPFVSDGFDRRSLIASPDLSFESVSVKSMIFF